MTKGGDKRRLTVPSRWRMKGERREPDHITLSILHLYPFSSVPEEKGRWRRWRRMTNRMRRESDMKTVSEEKTGAQGLIVRPLASS